MSDQSEQTETKEVKGWSGARYFTIDELAAMQPGLARLMPEVGQRYWKTYYAAKNGNWVLANFEIEEIKELMKFGAITRPKYEKHLKGFIQRDITALLQAIQKKDWRAFEEAFHQGIRDANDYHKLNDKGFVVWKLPDYPPPDLDLTPRE